MIVKPAIRWLNRDSDAELMTKIRTILKSMAENTAIYDSPAPSLADVQAALDDFAAGVEAAADGGRSVTAARNQLRSVLTGLVRALASYVQVACKGDLVSLRLSGFPIHKPVRQPAGIPSKPAGLIVRHGLSSGDLAARVNAVFGAVAYNWRLTSAAPGFVTRLAQTTAAAHTFTGLTPGVIYAVAVNALGTAGLSEWSQSASKMAV